MSNGNSLLVFISLFNKMHSITLHYNTSLQTHLFFEPFVVIRDSSISVGIANGTRDSPIDNPNKFIAEHKWTTRISLKLSFFLHFATKFSTYSDKLNVPNIFLVQLGSMYTKYSHAVRLKLFPRILRS